MLSISAIEEGQIDIEYFDKEPKTLDDRSLAVFHKDELHRSKNISKTTKGYYVLYLDSSLYDDAGFENIFESIIEDEIKAKEFISLCKELLSSRNNNDTAFELELIKIFISELKSTHAIKIKNDQKAQNTLVQKVKQFLELNEDITIDEVSKKFGYTKEHLIRVFKKSTGTTPHAYILNKKVHKGKDLIFLKQEQNISDTAYEAGFYDQSHFSKSFKRVFAVTPNSLK